MSDAAKYAEAASHMKNGPTGPTVGSYFSDPAQTVKLAMCETPYTSAVSIGVGYLFGASTRGSSLAPRLLGGAMTGAMVGTGIALAVSLAPAGLNGLYEEEFDTKKHIVISQVVLGGLSGMAGTAIAGSMY